jgi:hypothetical protein
MIIKTPTVILYSLVLLTAASLARAQVVRIQFVSEVTNVVGSALSGVTAGSIITGQITVDLAGIPQDGDPAPSFGSYGYAHREPGYVFRFDTAAQTIIYDSTNAAIDGGTSPGLFLYQLGDPSHSLGVQARDTGNPNAAILSFADITQPLTLLRGDYFPEDVNLDAGLARATFQYFDNFGTNAVVARVTAATMTIEPAATRTSLLSFRVSASTLSLRRKHILLRRLRGADRAFADERCRLAQRRLRHFQRSVRAHVRRKDAVLAAHLRADARAIIDAGCAADPGIQVF